MASLRRLAKVLSAVRPEVRPRVVLSFVALLSLAALSGVASAHEVTTRFEAPIPLDALYLGAGATVALTALVLSVSSPGTGGESGRTPRRSPSVVVPGRVADAARAVARAAFLLAFAGVLAAGLVGTQTPAENLATVFVWALWLKGLAVVAALVGDPWPALSPWRTLYDGLTRLEGETVALADYPDRLGEWPALAGFLAVVGVLENLTVVPTRPATTAVLLAAYAAAMVLGAVAFGPEWLRRADFFAVLYRLFGRVAPVARARTDRGLELSARPPWRGCERPVGSLALAAFVVATVYTVSFDGFASSPEYEALLFAAREATGLGPAVSAPLYLLGYLGFLAAFAGIAALTRRVAGGGRGAGEPSRRSRSTASAARALAPTLVPIAVGYELAHNAAFVLTRLGDFVGLLGGPELALLSWLSLPAFWAGQVLLVVGGHVVAVVAAHAVVSGPGGAGGAGRTARRHAPLTALMVGYTVLSLWVISRPVVA
ncbi:hypothetical protein NGM10_17135 (plasmid) [Halorussus salilacus]|uniref:hypothetical protein n=1 Tax=Halorussus salilacus TaxID=2953750 RepID=UPI0020A22FC4|nr:hypothetical protein [Halorussus salilacus]USZ69820.1 hypothetical protein NGM10_17135 [Halorussus salilacus]